MKKMNFFRFTVLGLLMMSSFSIYSIENPKVKLSADLNIQRLCRPNDPFCLSTAVGVGTGEEITLYPQIDFIATDPSDPTPIPTPASTIHYRGILSTVKERDGLRFIGIVSVDRFTITDYDTGEESFSYTITVEILDKDGISAKMSTTVGSVDKLNSVTLTGQTVKHYDYEYVPNFRIGRAMGPILQPTPISDTKEFRSFENDWNIISGSIN